MLDSAFLRKSLAGLTAAILATGIAGAQTFPARNIRFIGIATPGTTSDVIGRTVADPLSRQIGQSIVVENRAGAGGTLAAGAVARAEPDGHTLLLTSSAQSGISGIGTGLAGKVDQLPGAGKQSGGIDF